MDAKVDSDTYLQSVTTKEKLLENSIDHRACEHNGLPLATIKRSVILYLTIISWYLPVSLCPRLKSRKNNQKKKGIRD